MMDPIFDPNSLYMIETGLLPYLISLAAGLRGSAIDEKARKKAEEKFGASKKRLQKIALSRPLDTDLELVPVSAAKLKASLGDDYYEGPVAFLCAQESFQKNVSLFLRSFDQQQLTDLSEKIRNAVADSFEKSGLEKKQAVEQGNNFIGLIHRQVFDDPIISRYITYQGLHHISWQVDELRKFDLSRSKRNIPLQFPQQVEHFTAREEELKKLINDLQPGKIVTLCGPGGIGKSALAAEAVWQLAPEDKPPEMFPDGIIYLDFYTNPKAEQALEQVALSFNEKPEPTPIEAARRVLSGRKVLILLDGAENADDLPRVLSVTGNCGVLVTSQKHSDAAAEWLDIDPLPEPEAIRLLQAWCSSIAIDAEIGQRICELLGYLPLAVRLAGRYIRQTGERPADYLDWLKDQPLDALDHGQRRLESVPLLIERSVAKLSEPSLNALYLTGLLALAPFKYEVVAAALDIQPAAARQLLGELVSFGLLVKQNDHQDYAVSHRLIYTYTSHKALPMLEAAGRLADYYGDLARTQEKKGREGYDRLNDHRAHIMQVLAVCEQRQLWQSMTDLVMAIENYLDMQGYRSDQITAIEKGLKASKELKDRHGEGSLLGNLGIAYRSLGQYDKAIEYHNLALDIAREIGYRQGEGHALGDLGIAYRSLGQYDKTIEYHNLALDIAREIGDRRGEGVHLGGLGIAFDSLGQHDKAIEHYNLALDIAREIGDRQNEGVHLGNLGIAYRALGQHDKAIEYHNLALDIAREIGYRQGEGHRLGNLGNTYRSLGQYDKAIEYYNQALAIFEEIKSPYAEQVRKLLVELDADGK